MSKDYACVSSMAIPFLACTILLVLIIIIMMGAGCAGFLAPEEMRELFINSCNISAPNCAQAETALKVPTISSGREGLVCLAELLELQGSAQA